MGSDVLNHRVVLVWTDHQPQLLLVRVRPAHRLLLHGSQVPLLVVVLHRHFLGIVVVGHRLDVHVVSTAARVDVVVSTLRNHGRVVLGLMLLHRERLLLQGVHTQLPAVVDAALFGLLVRPLPGHVVVILVLSDVVLQLLVAVVVEQVSIYPLELLASVLALHVLLLDLLSIVALVRVAIVCRNFKGLHGDCLFLLMCALVLRAFGLLRVRLGHAGDRTVRVLLPSPFAGPLEGSVILLYLSLRRL